MSSVMKSSSWIMKSWPWKLPADPPTHQSLPPHSEDRKVPSMAHPRHRPVGKPGGSSDSQGAHFIAMLGMLHGQHTWLNIIRLIPVQRLGCVSGASEKWESNTHLSHSIWSCKAAAKHTPWDSNAIQRGIFHAKSGALWVANDQLQSKDPATCRHIRCLWLQRKLWQACHRSDQHVSAIEATCLSENSFRPPKPNGSSSYYISYHITK